MKLTRASNYALIALAHLVTRDKAAHPVASHTIAAKEGIPERFLLKVLLPLVPAGILRSVKGPNGGYALARPAKDITLLQVVEAVDGPIRGAVPPVGKGAAAALDKHLGAVCEQAAALVRGRLAKVTLADLARPK
jgi:Rrf2 family protein